MKILGALLELPAKEHYQSSPFTSKLGQIGQIGRQCCLAGCSKTAPRIFSITMGAEYLSYVKFIETHVRTFLPLNISAVGSVFILIDDNCCIKVTYLPQVHLQYVLCKYLLTNNAQIPL